MRGLQRRVDHRGQIVADRVQVHRVLRVHQPARERDGVGLAEIWSITAILNEPSQAVMRRLGLTEVARFDHPRVPAGHPVQPHVAYYRRRPGR